MEIRFCNPSELDAALEVGDKQLLMRPTFYNPAGPAVLGTLICQDKTGTVLDRAVLRVTGRGKISVIHCTEAVKPLAEQDSKSSGTVQSKVEN